VVEEMETNKKTRAVNNIYELFDETPDSLELISAIDSHAIGNFKFCDDKNDLIQTLRSDIASSLDNRLSLSSSSIDSQPQFVLLVEAQGFAKTIADTIIERFPKALIISTTKHCFAYFSPWPFCAL